MVSVIIPTYNRFPLLCEAIESVYSQTYTAYEIVVIDDGSTDETPQVPSLYPEIKYFRIGHTGYPGLVRNHGVARAFGTYIAFLDSDDIWVPEKLGKQIQLCESDAETVLVHTRETWKRCDRIISQRKLKHNREGDVFVDALRKCMIGPSTVMMKKSLFESLGGFREYLEIAEDYELWLRVTACHRVSYIDEPLIIKRAGHGNQLSEKYGQIEIFRIRALQELVDSSWFLNHATHEHHRLARQELSRKYMIYASGAEKRGKEAEAEESLRMSRLYADSDQRLL